MKPVREILQCTRCNSTDLIELPHGSISADPVYRCSGCQRKLRSPGSFVMWIFVLVLASAFAIGLPTMLLTMERPPGESVRPMKMLLYAGIGLVVAGYAIAQLFRPSARWTIDPNS